MSTSTTEQQQTSKDKKILQTIGYKEFISICSEYQIVETSIKKLLELAENNNTTDKVRADIYRWVIEMNIGKAKEIITEQETALNEWKIKKAKNETGNIADMFS